MRSKKRRINNKRNIIISSILVFMAILFTILAKVIDVKPVGLDNTNLGFSTINKYVFDLLGTSNLWYVITKYLGIIAILIICIYGLIGIIQLIKRKSLLKVDREIIILGIFYVIVMMIYVFFEKVIINYRPILEDGLLEASYPSSHTLLTLFVSGSAILINKKLYNNKYIKVINILLFIMMILMPVGRLLSGVHWFTDILGGVLISSALLMSFYTLIVILINKKGLF